MTAYDARMDAKTDDGGGEESSGPYVPSILCVVDSALSSSRTGIDPCRLLASPCPIMGSLMKAMPAFFRVQLTPGGVSPSSSNSVAYICLSVSNSNRARDLTRLPTWWLNRCHFKLTRKVPINGGSRFTAKCSGKYRCSAISSTDLSASASGRGTLRITATGTL
jgi:hypothetical protein